MRDARGSLEAKEAFTLDALIFLLPGPFFFSFLAREHAFMQVRRSDPANGPDDDVTDEWWSNPVATSQLETHS